jgi:hypothetical protein
MDSIDEPVEAELPALLTVEEAARFLTIGR